MFSSFINTNILYILPILWSIFYSKLRYIPIFVINTLLIFFATYQSHSTNELMFTLEVSSLFSVMLCIFHNRRYKVSGLLFLSLISTGLLLFALISLKADFVKQLFSFLPIGRNDIITYYYDICLSVLIIILIGAVPFSEWIVYLFTISNSFFKSICFITPMFISLLLLTRYNIEGIISGKILVFLGFAVSLYSSLLLLFEKKIRKIFVYIVCYFYGIQILLIGENSLQSSFLLNIWLIVSLITISASNIFTPFRVMAYMLYDLKKLFLQNIFYKITACLFFLSLIVCFLIYFIANNTRTNQFTIIAFNLFMCFLSKIVYILLKKDDNKSQTNNNSCTYKTENKRLYKNTILSFILFSLLIYVMIKYFKIYDFSSKNAVVNMSIKIGNKINIQMLSSIVILLISFVIFLPLSPFLISKQKPALLRGRSYWNIFISIGGAFKTAYEVTMTAMTEFYKTFKQYIKTTSSSSLENKLTNILYGNNIYYYIFFLLQIIVVLTIECVIT